jgi:hypothetical protein
MIDVGKIWGFPLDIGEDDVEYSTYLYGKSVALVGPAPTVVGSSQGDAIDSYDVVIRTNKAIPPVIEMSSDIGVRCDILYHCMNTSPKAGGEINVDVLIENGVKWLAAPYARRGRFHHAATMFEADNAGRLKYHNVDNSFYDSVKKCMGTMPNTGIMAIIDLLRHDVAEIYVTGFTFFRGGYHGHYRNGRSEAHTLNEMQKAGCHKIEPQIEFMKKVMKTDARFKADAPLVAILQEGS